MQIYFSYICLQTKVRFCTFCHCQLPKSFTTILWHYTGTLKIQNSAQGRRTINFVFLAVSQLQTWNVLETPSEKKLKDIIRKGDCSIGYIKELLEFEWMNQLKERKTYYYTFLFFPTLTYVSSMQLNWDPYKIIFNEKKLHIDESGIMEQLFIRKKPLKAKNSEPLETLKLEHFYFTFAGICVCLVASTVALLIETRKHIHKILTNIVQK